MPGLEEWLSPRRSSPQGGRRREQNSAYGPLRQNASSSRLPIPHGDGNVVNMTTSAAASRAVSAADANREFSRLLRRVRAGHSVVITSHGRPIARMTPISEGSAVSAAARRALFDRLSAEPVVKAGRWTRDELHRR